MENPIRIFVEGIADSKFIKDYVSHILGIDLLKDDVIETEGWTNITSKKEKGEMILNKMTNNSDNGGINLVIFDADSDFKKRKLDILEWKENKCLEFELFLLPNDSDTGSLENLLEKIINPNNSPIFDCWDGFEECLGTKTITGRAKPLTIPAKKTKIYGYLETLLGTTKSEKDKIKERERNYKEKSHWELDSDFLDPLKEFLTKNLK